MQKRAKVYSPESSEQSSLGDVLGCFSSVKQSDSLVFGMMNSVYPYRGIVTILMFETLKRISTFLK